MKLALRLAGIHLQDPILLQTSTRGGEWYHEKRGSENLAGSRNLGSVFDKSQSLVFAWFVFTFFESRNFLPKRISNQDLCVSASLKFYHSPPLQLDLQNRVLTQEQRRGVGEGVMLYVGYKVVIYRYQAFSFSLSSHKNEMLDQAIAGSTHHGSWLQYVYCQVVLK